MPQDPVLAKEVEPIIAGILFTALSDLSDEVLAIIPIKNLALYLANALTFELEPEHYDAIARVRQALTKLTWKVGPDGDEDRPASGL